LRPNHKRVEESREKKSFFFVAFVLFVFFVAV